jgi:hypothetical protein
MGGFSVETETRMAPVAANEPMFIPMPSSCDPTFMTVPSTAADKLRHRIISNTSTCDSETNYELVEFAETLPEATWPQQIFLQSSDMTSVDSEAGSNEFEELWSQAYEPSTQDFVGDADYITHAMLPRFFTEEECNIAYEESSVAWSGHQDPKLLPLELLLQFNNETNVFSGAAINESQELLTKAYEPSMQDSAGGADQHAKPQKIHTKKESKTAHKELAMAISNHKDPKCFPLICNPNLKKIAKMLQSSPSSRLQNGSGGGSRASLQ